MVKVKVCGLTRAVDVEKAVELGADALGFVFEPTSPRYIFNKSDYVDTINHTPPFVPSVAVYGKYEQRRDPCVLAQSINYQDKRNSFETVLDSVARQIEPADHRPGIFGFRFQSEIDVLGALADVERAIEDSHVICRAILLDGFSEQGFGGTGVKANWHLSAEIVKNYKRHPIILAGGLNPDNVASAIEAVQPYAVDVSSGIESSPGIKDHIKMRDFIQAAKRI